MTTIIFGNTQGNIIDIINSYGGAVPRKLLLNDVCNLYNKELSGSDIRGLQEIETIISAEIDLLCNSAIMTMYYVIVNPNAPTSGQIQEVYVRLTSKGNTNTHLYLGCPVYSPDLDAFGTVTDISYPSDVVFVRFNRAGTGTHLDTSERVSSAILNCRDLDVEI